MNGNISTSLIPRVNLYDTKGYELVDTYVHCVPTIEVEHYNTHKGLAYLVNGSVVLTASAVTYLQINTDGKAMHFRRALTNTGTTSLTYTVFEGATVTTPGTPLVPFNLNRVSTNTSAITVYKDSADVTGGTELTSILLPGSKTTSTSDISGFEIIYKPSTTYVAQITNTGNQTNTLYFQFFWYEL